VNPILLSLLLLQILAVSVSSSAVSYPPNNLVVDLNYDGKVDKADLLVIARAFKSKPGDSAWNPDADIDHDNAITIMDLATIAVSFGSFPPRSYIIR
jgi:hypothetical protein